LFTFTGKISVRREVPDATAGDEGIAPAIAEETDAVDGCLAADRNFARKGEQGQKMHLIATHFAPGFILDVENILSLLCYTDVVRTKFQI